MSALQTRGFEYDLPPNPNKQIVRTGEAFEVMAREIESHKAFTFDFETSGLAWYKHARACGLALGVQLHKDLVRCWYIPFAHQTAEPQMDRSLIDPFCKQLLSDTSKLRIAHNIGFDEHISRREGWPLAGPRYDTLIAARLYDENTPAALKSRAVTDLGIKQAAEWEQHLQYHIRDLAKMYSGGVTAYKDAFGYSQVPIEIAGRYACYDIDFTARLYDLYERVHHLSEQFPRIVATEMALTEVLCDVEENGLPIDVDYLDDMRSRCSEEMKRLESNVWRAFRVDPFSLTNDNHLRAFLVKSGFNLTKKSPGGKDLSVDSEVLGELAASCPDMHLIREWRLLNKLATTYTDSVLSRLDAKGVLHGSFRQLGTTTGRLSCGEPNLQNFPRDNDARAKAAGGVDPFSIKRAFVNRGPGWCRLYYDYSQAELRVLSHYTQDGIMIDAFQKGDDIHTRTSIEVFGEATPQNRRTSKTINFGLVYGMSAVRLGKQLGVPQETADAYMEAYFRRYDSIPKYKQAFWSELVRTQGVFTNRWGRRRKVEGLQAADEWQRRRAERESFASLIQGTASELTKESLVRLHRYFISEGIQALIVNTIHDEIQIDMPIEYLGKHARAIKTIMEDFHELDPVPIVVDGSYSITSWAEKHSLPL